MLLIVSIEIRGKSLKKIEVLLYDRIERNDRNLKF